MHLNFYTYWNDELLETEVEAASLGEIIPEQDFLNHYSGTVFPWVNSQKKLVYFANNIAVPDIADELIKGLEVVRELSIGPNYTEFHRLTLIGGKEEIFVPKTGDQLERAQTAAAELFSDGSENNRFFLIALYQRQDEYKFQLLPSEGAVNLRQAYEGLPLDDIRKYSADLYSLGATCDPSFIASENRELIYAGLLNERLPLIYNINNAGKADRQVRLLHEGIHMGLYLRPASLAYLNALKKEPLTVSQIHGDLAKYHGEKIALEGREQYINIPGPEAIRTKLDELAVYNIIRKQEDRYSYLPGII